jgi:hypothetical protein
VQPPKSPRTRRRTVGHSLVPRPTRPRQDTPPPRVCPSRYTWPRPPTRRHRPRWTPKFRTGSPRLRRAELAQPRQR